MPKSKPLHDGFYYTTKGRVYVRAWKERRETIVQVWHESNPVDQPEPDGDWAMPAFLNPTHAIEQAIIQTPRGA